MGSYGYGFDQPKIVNLAISEMAIRHEKRIESIISPCFACQIFISL